MSEIAIQIEKLGKQYRIGAQQDGYKTIRDTIMDAMYAPFRRAKRIVSGQAYGAADLEQTLWALRDVSFEVKHGEVVGIIGSNGAGKSTLLKLLSQITEPSEGSIDIYGRVGALLEVGTGFHQELTGRENLYLNGSILGMTRSDINRKFDEIVEFAGVEKFIDTPVKHYSSGMRLRLGFSVAAHLEPEILVVDEVLAVGDAEFQKKCIGKMSDVAGEGRTVLFVSHNMAAIANLCPRTLLLQAGQLLMDGQTDEIISKYHQMFTADNTRNLADRIDRKGNGKVRFVDIQVEGLDEPDVYSGKGVRFILGYEAEIDAPLYNVSFAIHIRDQFTGRLITLFNEWSGQIFNDLPPKGKIVCEVDQLLLTMGIYDLELGLKIGYEVADVLENAFSMDVLPTDYFGTGKLPRKGVHGVVIHQQQWRTL